MAVAESTERSVEMSKGATNWGKALRTRLRVEGGIHFTRRAADASRRGGEGEGDAEQTLGRV